MSTSLRVQDASHDVAQICTNGHVVNSSSIAFPEYNQAFCAKCGEAVQDKCISCGKSIRGASNSGRLFNNYTRPSYCQHCGRGFPWTETALAAATDYAAELDSLTPDDKMALTSAISELASDTPRTPLAASRFQKLMKKIGPASAAIVQKTIETVITEAAKKLAGF